MKLDPGSLGLSAALVGLMMAGLIFSVPDFVKKIDPGIRIVDIIEPTPPPPDPEPLRKKPEVLKAEPQTHIIPLKQDVTIDKAPAFVITPGPAKVDVTEGTGPAIGGDILTKPAAPVMIGAEIDPRFAGSYQPDYPSNERRLGNEGRVVVKVLIGTDGRVKQIELVSSPSSSFFEATRRRALEKWRFKPGTRDGVPMETWKTMAVRFVLNDE